MQNKLKSEESLFGFEGTKCKKHETFSHSGGESGEDPPVPIPNTEVKLPCVENTWRATARENRLLPLYMIKASLKDAFFSLFTYGLTGSSSGNFIKH